MLGPATRPVSTAAGLRAFEPSATWLIAILVAAVLVRLVFSFVVARELMGIVPERESTDGYHLIAQSLYAGDGYRFKPGGSPTMQRPPAYPAFLFGLFTIDGGVNYKFVQVVQALLGAVSCAFLFLLGRWAHSAALGLIAAAMYAFYPNSVIYSARLYSENLYFPLFLAFAYYLARASLEGSARKGIAAGALWGLGLLTRGTLLPLPFVLPFGIGVSPPHRSPASRWLRWAVPAIVAGCVVLTPWMLRNYSLSGAIVPTSSWSWTPLYSGALVSKEMVGWKDLSSADRSAAVQVRNLFMERFQHGERSPFDTPQGELAHDKIAQELTMAEWKSRPLAVAGQAAAGLVMTWFLTFDTGTRLTSLIIHLPLLVLFVVGVVQMARSEKESFVRLWPALGLILFVDAFHAFAYPHVRYMSPAIALSFLFSALPLLRLAQHFLSRRQQPSAIPAG